MTPMQAVERILGWIAPDAATDVFETEYDGYSLFAIKVYEWDYEDHDHTQAEKDETPALTARVNHMYPYEVIFILDAD